MRRFGLFALGLFAAGLVAGCGGDGPKLTPVSGVVKVDGKPYPNAMVSFQPTGGKDPMNPGKGSMGITDAQGRFTLVYGGSENGAVVGKHTVRISTLPGRGFQEKMPETGTPDGIVGAKPDLEFDPIP